MKSIRALIIIGLVAIFSGQTAFSQTQFPEYKMKNRHFLKAIEIYTDSLDRFYNGTGVLFVEFVKLRAYDSIPSEVNPGSISYKLSDRIEKTNLIFRFYSDGEAGFLHKFPTGYFYHKRRPYLIYTDIDQLAHPPSKAAIRKIKKVFRPFEVRGQFRIAPYWVVAVKDSSIFTLYRFGEAMPTPRN